MRYRRRSRGSTPPSNLGKWSYQSRLEVRGPLRIYPERDHDGDQTGYAQHSAARPSGHHENGCRSRDPHQASKAPAEGTCLEDLLSLRVCVRSPVGIGDCELLVEVRQREGHFRFRISWSNPAGRSAYSQRATKSRVKPSTPTIQLCVQAARASMPPALGIQASAAMRLRRVRGSISSIGSVLTAPPPRATARSCARSQSGKDISVPLFCPQPTSPKTIR